MNEKKIFKKILCFVLIVSLFNISGCQKAKTPISKTGVYFDTLISVTLYEKNSYELIDECFAIADRYDRLFSKTNPLSDASKINTSHGEYVKISEETLYLIKKAFEYEDISEGKFSVMCGAITDLWDISKLSQDALLQKSAVIPKEEEIKAALSLTGNNTLTIDEKSCAVKINKAGAKIDLGAVAKGYIADKMKEYLLSEGVSSGIIELGGNVLVIGDNPMRSDKTYAIGIAEPFSESSKVITSVNVSDTSVVTSGNYQRYFISEGQKYHHIIDLTTGYPAESALNSVTVITNSSTEADILSTVCFLLGEKKGAELIDSLDNTEAIFISDENEIL